MHKGSSNHARRKGSGDILRLFPQAGFISFEGLKLGEGQDLVSLKLAREVLRIQEPLHRK